jgi:hypothetical protein
MVADHNIHKHSNHTLSHKSQRIQLYDFLNWMVTPIFLLGYLPGIFPRPLFTRRDGSEKRIVSIILRVSGLTPLLINKFTKLAGSMIPPPYPQKYNLSVADSITNFRIGTQFSEYFSLSYA